MKVVIDTNVVVSAILRGRDPGAIIRYVITHPQCQWVASEAILVEYRAVIRRPKFRLPVEIIESWDKIFDSKVTCGPANTAPDLPRDPKDAMFLGCAIDSEADYLVTGDQDLLELRGAFTTIICTVSEFIQLVVDKEQSS